MPPGVDLTAYRIVQEALTNVLKHTAGTAAGLLVDYKPGAVHLVTPTTEERTTSRLCCTVASPPSAMTPLPAIASR